MISFHFDLSIRQITSGCSHRKEAGTLVVICADRKALVISSFFEPYIRRIIFFVMMTSSEVLRQYVLL
jgi:hypothetical protein